MAILKQKHVFKSTPGAGFGTGLSEVLRLSSCINTSDTFDGQVCSDLVDDLSLLQLVQLARQYMDALKLANFRCVCYSDLIGYCDL